MRILSNPKVVKKGENDKESSPVKKIKALNFTGDLNLQFIKDLKLVSPMSVSNMVLFDKNNKLRRYDCPEQVLEEFYELRLEFYDKRKQMALGRMSHELKKISNQARFILEVIENDLIISKRKKNGNNQRFNQEKIRCVV